MNEDQFGTIINSPGESVEIAAFPASVQRHLDEAAALMRKQQQSEANSVLQAAGTELARSSPELFALSVAAQFGAQSLTTDEQEIYSETTTVDLVLFGMRIGRDVTTFTRSGTKRRQVRFG